MTTKSFLRATVTALAVCLSLPALAEDTTAGNKADLRQLAPAFLRQDLLKGVYEAIEIPGLNQLWVASTPSFGKATPGFVDILDATDLRPLRRIELPRQAFALAHDPAHGLVYVGNTMDGSLTVVDVASGMILDTIQLGKPEGEGFEHTRMIAVDPVTGRVVVTSPSEDGAVWVVDPAQGNAVQRIDKAGLWSAGLAVNSKTGRAYTTGGGINEVLVVDLKTGERAGSFSTGDTKAEGAEASQHFFVNAALDADGNRLFAADANSGTLYVFNTESGEVAATAPIGPGTLDVVYSGVNDLIAVSYRGVTREAPEGSGGIVLLNGTDFSRIADIPLPAHPNSLSFGEGEKTLFVTVKAPMEKEHPLFREGGADSVLRIDVQTLNKQLAAQ